MRIALRSNDGNDTFGKPIPELVHVGVDLRARLADYHAAQPADAGGGANAQGGER